MGSVTVIYKVRARRGCRPGYALTMHGRPVIRADARAVCVFGGRLAVRRAKALFARLTS